MAEFLANLIIKGKIECLTGMHIGGSKEKFEIGGVDNPVIRDPKTNLPYIPGSSLKGKLRTLLEFKLGVVKIDDKGSAGPSKDPKITNIFGGTPKDENVNGPTRLIVRDAFPDEETIEMWKNANTELLYTEYKAENTIDRLSAEANPRFIERVLKGSKFDLILIFSIYDIDKETYSESLNNLLNSMKLLEHSSLGGGGSRGSGEIKLRLCDPVKVSKEDYVKNEENYKNALSFKNIAFDKSIDEITTDNNLDKLFNKIQNQNTTAN